MSASALPYRADVLHCALQSAPDPASCRRMRSPVASAGHLFRFRGHLVRNSGHPSYQGSRVVPQINYREAIERLAGPPSHGETKERRISNAARKLKLPFRTVRRIYYREILDPKTSIHLAFEALEQPADLVSRLEARIDRLEAGRGGAS